MTNEQIPSKVAWNVQQRSYARLIAIGYSQSEAARQLAVPLRTAQRWMADEGFCQHIQDLHETAWSRVEAGIMANVELAIEVERRWLSGEKVDEKRYRDARSRIDRILDRLLFVEPPETENRNPTLGATVNISLPPG